MTMSSYLTYRADGEFHNAVHGLDDLLVRLVSSGDVDQTNHLAYNVNIRLLRVALSDQSGS